LLPITGARRRHETLLQAVKSSPRRTSEPPLRLTLPDASRDTPVVLIGKTSLPAEHHQAIGQRSTIPS
jgi:hypothetical protein